MKHFTTTEWVDFVNQVAASSKRIEMQKHLDSGCERCLENAGLWQKVRKTADAERRYQPSADSVRLAKAAFAAAGWAAKPKRVRGLVEVLFDSFRQPALAGTRSAATGVRQMLYRAEPYQVDIQIEAKPGGNRLTVTGQLLNLSSPGSMGSNVQVTLSDRRGSTVHTVTNQFGEFSGEIQFSGDLELSFPRHEEKPIVISLRNALDRLPGGKS
ncbi:MAG TPA: hypothetical protein VJN42_10925 [Candidatus Acidoferrum sp.]|nr:hypothetical protein [Candidatus Acidoferrum sp.]